MSDLDAIVERVRRLDPETGEALDRALRRDGREVLPPGWGVEEWACAALEVAMGWAPQTAARVMISAAASIGATREQVLAMVVAILEELPEEGARLSQRIDLRADRPDVDRELLESMDRGIEDSRGWGLGEHLRRRLEAHGFFTAGVFRER